MEDRSFDINWDRLKPRLTQLVNAVSSTIGRTDPARLAIAVKKELGLDHTQRSAIELESHIREFLALSARMIGVRSVRDLLEIDGIETLVQIDRSTIAERLDEAVADVLTGAWFALYFLGCPFSPPWERAVQIAEPAGGFPRGACVSKALGDVYRDSRRIYLSDYMVEVEDRCTRQQSYSPSPNQQDGNSVYVEPPGIVVYTRRPLTVFTPEAYAESVCIPELNQLGKLYVQTQVKLYIRAELPITVILSATSVKELLQRGEVISKRILQTVCEILGHRSRMGQYLQIAEDQEATLGIPTVILGHNRGFYTLSESDSNRPDAPFSGSRFGSEVEVAYRRRLGELRVTTISWDSVEHLYEQVRDWA